MGLGDGRVTPLGHREGVVRELFYGVPIIGAVVLVVEDLELGIWVPGLGADGGTGTRGRYCVPPSDEETLFSSPAKGCGGYCLDWEYFMAFGLKVEGGAWPWRILIASYASTMHIIIKSATVTVATRCILRKRDGTIFRRKGGSLLKKRKKEEKVKVVQKMHLAAFL